MHNALQIIAACQGAFIIGYIFQVILLIARHNGLKEVEVATYLFSSLIGKILVMCFTLKIVYQYFLILSLGWQIVLVAAYLCFDVSLFIMFKRIAKNQLKR